MIKVIANSVIVYAMFIFSSMTVISGPSNIPPQGMKFTPHLAKPSLKQKPAISRSAAHAITKRVNAKINTRRAPMAVRKGVLKPAAQRTHPPGVQVHRRAPAISTKQHLPVGASGLGNRFGAGSHVLVPAHRGRLGKTGNGGFAPPHKGGFAPSGGSHRQAHSPTGRLNNVMGKRNTSTHRGGFAPEHVSKGRMTSSGFAPVRSSKNNRGATPDGTLQRSLNRSHPSSRQTQFIPHMPPAQRKRSKDDRRSGEYANTIINQWAEDDMAIGGGKVPDSDNAPIRGSSPSAGKHTDLGVEYNNGDITQTEHDGSKTIHHQGGSTTSLDTQGGLLDTSSGVKTIPGGEKGGTYFVDSVTHTRGHFGATNVHDDAGGIKPSRIGDGEMSDGSHIFDEKNGSITVEHTDGSIDTWQRDGSHLSTGPGMKTNAAMDGGTDVYDTNTGVRAHFGGGTRTTEESRSKYVGGGKMQNPDASTYEGKKNEGDSNTDNDSDSDSGSSSSSSSSSSDDDTDSSSDDSDSTASDDTSDDSDSTASDDTSSDTDSSDDSDHTGDSESSYNPEGGGDGNSGGSAWDLYNKLHKPGNADAPANGGHARGDVSQPGPDSSRGSAKGDEVGGHINPDNTGSGDLSPLDNNAVKSPLNMVDPDRFGGGPVAPANGAADQLRHRGDSVNPGGR